MAARCFGGKVILSWLITDHSVKALEKVTGIQSFIAERLYDTRKQIQLSKGVSGEMRSPFGYGV